jgi:hypothetical protein
MVLLVGSQTMLGNGLLWFGVLVCQELGEFGGGSMALRRPVRSIFQGAF